MGRSSDALMLANTVFLMILGSAGGGGGGGGGAGRLSNGRRGGADPKPPLAALPEAPVSGVADAAWICMQGFAQGSECGAAAGMQGIRVCWEGYRDAGVRPESWCQRGSADGEE